MPKPHCLTVVLLIVVTLMSLAWTLFCGVQYTSADGHPWMLNTPFGPEPTLYAAFCLNIVCGIGLIGFVAFAIARVWRRRAATSKKTEANHG